MSYPLYAEVMGPVLAAIANGTLIPPRPARKPSPALSVTFTPMTEAEAIAADLHNNVDKAERAHAAHLRNAMRLPSYCHLRNFT